MIHMTCAVHGLHWTSEEVCGQFSAIDKIVSNVEHFLINVISYIIYIHIMFLQ